MLYYVHDHGAIAQLARASHWQCEGREFESLLLHHDFPSSSLSCFFCALKRHKNCSAEKIMPSIAQRATEGDRAKHTQSLNIWLLTIYASAIFFLHSTCFSLKALSINSFSTLRQRQKQFPCGKMLAISVYSRLFYDFFKIISGNEVEKLRIYATVIERSGFPC